MNKQQKPSGTSPRQPAGKGSVLNPQRSEDTSPDAPDDAANEPPPKTVQEVWTRAAAQGAAAAKLMTPEQRTAQMRRNRERMAELAADQQELYGAAYEAAQAATDIDHSTRPANSANETEEWLSTLSSLMEMVKPLPPKKLTSVGPEGNNTIGAPSTLRNLASGEKSASANGNDAGNLAAIQCDTTGEGAER
jgi:hypothetical protein